ncbi:MAG: Omp28-related outer membrane protein [Bacteroidales bacterium]|nr:Omp28-related outer membrane protein [Bacteroidales bacterium]
MKKTLLFLAAALTFSMAAHAQTVFSENFNSLSDGAIPQGWVTYGDNLTNHYTSPATLNDSWSALQQSMICITWTEETSPVDRWLVTPSITMPATNPMLLVDLMSPNYGPGSPYAESLKVMVSTTDNQKASFTLLDDLGELAVDNNTYAVDLSNYAGQSVYLAFVSYTNDGMYIYLDNVEVRSLPTNSISAVSASVPSWTAQNGISNVTLTVSNTGYAALAAFDVTYSVNGGDEQTINVTNIDVAPFTNYNYTFPVQVTDLGVALINITVSNPNNDTDHDASDNSVSCQTNVYDPAATTQRTSLLEHFTTAQCQYCPGGHERLEQAMNGFENRICWVAHHVGFGTDAMTITESNQIMSLYGASGTWAPAMTLDRNVEYAIEPNDDGVVGSVGNVSDLVTLFTNATNSPAFATIELSGLSYDPQTRQLSVTVSGSLLSDLSGLNPRLSLYLTQDGIYGVQQSTGGTTIQRYEHNHVIRACISNVWGDEAITSTSAGSTYSKTFTYTLPTKFSANHCRLVAFVNEYGTDMKHRTILNATKSDYLLSGSDPTTGIGDVQAGMEVVTYPNPATEMVYVTAESAIRSYQMVDAMGRQVMSHENLNADILELNVSELAAGIYFITITTDHGTATQRVSVAK